MSSDGNLISQRNFERYGLSVERRDEPAASGDPWPTYYLRFDHEPELFDVRTDEGATVQKRRIAPGMRADALHIALATVARVDVLVSWNFKHIVNLKRIHAYNAVNLKKGYPLLEIRTPREVPSDE